MHLKMLMICFSTLLAETECSITEDTEDCELTITLTGECTKNSTTNNKCKFRAVTVEENGQHMAYVRIYKDNTQIMEDKQVKLLPGDPEYQIGCASFNYGEDKIMVVKEQICECENAP